MPEFWGQLIEAVPAVGGAASAEQVPVFARHGDDPPSHRTTALGDPVPDRSAEGQVELDTVRFAAAGKVP